MKKYLYLTICFAVLCLTPFASLQAAENDLEITNSEIEGVIVYPSQWDIEVLDFTLTPTEDDVLNALTVKNLGLAPASYFEKVILYEDDGDGIFEGWQRDIKIAEAAYYDPNQIWYWQNLGVNMSQDGKRFFVTVETKRNANIVVDRRTVQMSIPKLYDEDNDDAFDFSKDAGIFMASKNNGPDGTISNSQSHTIYKKATDPLPPKSIISYPLDGDALSYLNSDERVVTIKGFAKDQCGSTPSWVKINITKDGESNDEWQEVVPTGQNYATWEFEWTAVVDGTYIIKTRSRDWIGNVKTESGITVTISTEEQEEEKEEESEEDSEEEKEEDTSDDQEEELIDINDGDLVRAQGDFKVYVINGNYKRWIQSAEIFNFYGHFNFLAVKETPKSQLENYPDSWLVRADEDTKVYEVNADGTKHWLNITAEEFTASGRNWDMVYIINSNEINFYITGADITE